MTVPSASERSFTSLFSISLLLIQGLAGCSNGSNTGGTNSSATGGQTSSAASGGSGPGNTAGGASSTTASSVAPTLGGSSALGGSANGGASNGGTTSTSSGGTTAVATTTLTNGGGTASGGTSATSGSNSHSGGTSESSASSDVGGRLGNGGNPAQAGAAHNATGTSSGGRGNGGGTGRPGGGNGSPIGGASTSNHTGTPSDFQLTSTKLPDGAAFPTSATCESTASSSQLPPLSWTGAPEGTKSFAMVFVDETLIGATPPSTNGFHSAMWDIPASVNALPEGLPAGSPPAGVAGLETVKQKKAPSGNAWLGPCPNFPNTAHTKTDTYQFRLYALNVETLPSNTSSMSIQQIYTYLEALPPLGVAILTGTSNAAATALK